MIIFWCLCALVVSLVAYGVRENRMLTGRFAHSGEPEKKAQLDRSDLEYAGRASAQETIILEFNYKDAR